MSDAADSPARGIAQRIRVSREVTLRAPVEEDAVAIYRTVDANRERLRRWLPWLDQNASVDDSRAFVENCTRARLAKESATWLIDYKGRLAGVISINELKWQNRTCEIGYWIADEFEGKGVVSACVTALVDLAFTQLALHRVEIRAATDNERSRAIPERLGFTYEGTTRDSEWLYDHFESLVIYSLLSTDARA
ncbi:MAG: GNAT family N-acetyltransferase [Pseudomonadales bacterium]|jgi:ribosomal-protein-serine acetyltransferase|nr:GNAT family N-acetyltransferase [Gammaproteobacteria bacterium]